jgi:hypothetical protein
MREDPDFWAAAGGAELLLYKAIGAGDLAATAAQVAAVYDDLHQRVTASSLWASVYDQIGFVLSGYSEKASANERTAARQVLETLRDYVVGSPEES